MNTANIKDKRDFEAWFATLGLDPNVTAQAPDVTIRPASTVGDGPLADATDATLDAGPVIATDDPGLIRAEVADLATLTFDQDADIPTADLQLADEIGRGGMGVVLRAHQRSLRRDVAVKRLLPHAVHAKGVRSLLYEARLTGQLEHPSIVPVHALGLGHDGLPVIVMKRISGVAWRDMILDDAHEAWSQVNPEGQRLRWHIRVLLQVCHAIEFAHDHGIIHRDLKPENIMIGGYGEVYVLDWGIAMELDEEGREDGSKVAGTPAYMAPEQVEGGPFTERTDVYLLGAALHEVLTGQPRHSGTTVFQVMIAASLSEPVDFGKEVPAELAAICNRATAANPGDRQPSVRHVRRELEDLLQHMTSIELAEEASARLGVLCSITEVPAESRNMDRVRRLSTECRFGFKQALRLWPDNAEAEDQLERTLALLAEAELDIGNTSAAEAAIAEMRLAPPALQTRLGAHRADERARDARLVALDRLERGLDPRISGRVRAAFVWSIASVLLVISLLIVLGYVLDIFVLSWPASIGLAGAFNLLFWGVALVVRRWVQWTPLNRKLTTIFAFAMLGLLGLRTLDMVLGLTVDQSLVVEYAVFGIEVAFAAATLDKRLFAAVGVLAAFAIGFPIWPDATVMTYTLGIAAMSVCIGWLWSKDDTSSREAQPEV